MGAFLGSTSYEDLGYFNLKKTLRDVCSRISEEKTCIKNKAPLECSNIIDKVAFVTHTASSPFFALENT